MTRQDLASTAFAVLGVYLILSRLPEAVIASAFALIASQEATDTFSTFIAPMVFVVLSAAAGAALIALRDHLARWLFGPPAMASSDDASRLQAIAFSVLGVYLAIVGGSRAVGGALASQGAAAWAGPGIQCALGVAIFLWSDGLSGLWVTLRQAGRNRDKRAV